MRPSSRSPPSTTSSSPRMGLPISPSPRLSQQITMTPAYSQYPASRKQQTPTAEKSHKSEFDHHLYSNNIQEIASWPLQHQCCCQHHNCHQREASRSRSTSLERELPAEEVNPKTKADPEISNTKLLQKFKHAIGNKFVRQKQHTPLPVMGTQISKHEALPKSFSKHRQQYLQQQQPGRTYTEVVVEHWAE